MSYGRVINYLMRTVATKGAYIFVPSYVKHVLYPCPNGRITLDILPDYMALMLNVAQCILHWCFALILLDNLVYLEGLDVFGDNFASWV